MDALAPALPKVTFQEIKTLVGWLGAHVIAGLLPLWGSVLLLKLFGASFGAADLVKNGEFALYAAAMAGSALFLVLRELAAPFPYRTTLGLGSAAVLVFSTLIFAGVFIAARLAQPPAALPAIDIWSLTMVSVPLYLFAVLLTLGATLVDLLRTSYNPHSIPDQELAKLRAQFQSTEGGGGGS